MDAKILKPVEASSPLTTLEIRSSTGTGHEQDEHQTRAALENALDALDLRQLRTLEISLCADHKRPQAYAHLFESSERWPALERVYVRLVSPESAAIPQVLLDIESLCRKQKLELTVDLVLPASADAFAGMSDPRSPFALIIALGRSLKARQIGVRWLIPMTGPLVFRIEGLFLLAGDEAADVLLVPPQRLCAGDNPDSLSDDEKLFIRDFVTYRLLESDSPPLAAGARRYYAALLDFLQGHNPAPVPESVSILNYSTDTRDWSLTGGSATAAPGSISISAQTREEKAGRPLSGLTATFLEISGVLIGGLRAYAANLLSGGKAIPLNPDTPEKFTRVLLIGAYGGEHIGDAAILGGVLYRIHRRFGVTEAVLMSQRPAHTRHLIPMLDVPVNVEVDLYDWPQIRRHVADADCIVFAGGPLIDLPKQLIRHLYAVSIGRRKNKPFIAEGIGPGPFARLPSRVTAHRLMNMADSISLRTTDSANHELMKGRDAAIGRCPAFDYLETRGETLGCLPDSERVAIDELLAGTQGRNVIGINIRPIGHLYTAGADGDVEAYTRRIEQRFEERFAAGLTAFHEKSDTPPCFIFFPMNAIQFGMSDLLSAWRIKRLLGPGVDFRVWQADASLDGVVALLRRIDIAVTMRFHATIFALSQQCKVVGIDYRIGKKDKIAELLEDVGQGENCARIDLLTGDWLEQRLAALVVTHATR